MSEKKHPAKAPEGAPDGGMPPREKFDFGTLKRLGRYMAEYKGTLIVVTVCILLSSIASAASSLFLQTLIDDYILPLIGVEDPVFSGLIKALVVIGAVYLSVPRRPGSTAGLWLRLLRVP